MSKRDGQIALIRGPEEFSACLCGVAPGRRPLAIYEPCCGSGRRPSIWWRPARWMRSGTGISPISAQLVALAPGARTWVDLGSGAGFPGLVVAILLAMALTPHP